MRIRLLRAILLAAFLIVGFLALPTQQVRAFEDAPPLLPNAYEPITHDLGLGELYTSLPGTFDSSALGVFAPDRRVQISETTVAPYSMIAFIQTEWSDGSISSCSGFLVGPRTVATAGHCVFDRSRHLGWAIRVLVSPGANGAQKPFGSLWATAIASVAGWTAATGTVESLDFAAVTLPTDVGTATGTFGLAERSGASLRAGTFTVAGYPADKSLASLWSASGALASTDAGLLYYRLPVTHGNSGGPIWEQAASGPTIVGIVEGMVQTDTTPLNIAVRVSQPVIDFYRTCVGGPDDAPSIATAAPVTMAP